MTPRSLRTVARALAAVVAVLAAMAAPVSAASDGTTSTSCDGVLLPRAVHPGAWWLWALGLATAASRTTNPLLLLLVLAVAGSGRAARRSHAPWARSFTVFLKLGLVVVAIRVTAQVLFGAAGPGTVLVTLPEVPLPAGSPGSRSAGRSRRRRWRRRSSRAAAGDRPRLHRRGERPRQPEAAAGEPAGRALRGRRRRRGRPVVRTVARHLGRADPRRAPAAGRPDRGLRSIVGVAMPVLEDALERSLALAAAMDSRGYGRQAAVPRATRRLTAGLTLGGLAGTCLGVYGLLDGRGPAVLGLPTLLGGVLAAAAGLRLGGRRTAADPLPARPVGRPPSGSPPAPERSPRLPRSSPGARPGGARADARPPRRAAAAVAADGRDPRRAAARLAHPPAAGRRRRRGATRPAGPLPATAPAPAGEVAA
jgi:energy-coupling factor transport system permease protein